MGGQPLFYLRHILCITQGKETAVPLWQRRKFGAEDGGIGGLVFIYRHAAPLGKRAASLCFLYVASRSLLFLRSSIWVHHTPEAGLRRVKTTISGESSRSCNKRENCGVAASKKGLFL
jgi:hypothetical protein